ncbi:hypothetical protein D1007_11086 [Hordeum vulgare]|nr:hypothetical protein D1007_11086 [Hordeum vulgare]
METIHVWVLDKGRRWNRHYRFRHPSLPRTYFAYGKYVLTLKDFFIYVHYASRGESSSDVVCVPDMDQGTLITSIRRRSQTFVYIETTVPLAAYKATSN